MIDEIRALLAELSTLAEEVDQDERRILQAAQARLSELDGAPEADAERAVLQQVIAKALLALGQ